MTAEEIVDIVMKAGYSRDIAHDVVCRFLTRKIPLSQEHMERWALKAAWGLMHNARYREGDRIRPKEPALCVKMSDASGRVWHGAYLDQSQYSISRWKPGGSERQYTQKEWVRLG